MDVHPIGWVSSPRDEPVDDDWATITATITLDPQRFTPDVLRGLEEFSHVDVIYVFDRVDPAAVQTGARHPRGNRDWPEVGIFAQRAKARPNRIGVSTCRLLEIEGLTVRVQALDAIDGTPVLDLKALHGGVRAQRTHAPTAVVTRAHDRLLASAVASSRQEDVEAIGSGDGGAVVFGSA